MNESIEFKSKYTVDDNGYYGQFGGAYIPEMLHHRMFNDLYFVVYRDHSIPPGI